MRKRHALPKDDGRGWQRPANPPPPARACQYRPLVAFPAPGGYAGCSHMYPVWGHPHAAAAAAAGFPPWQPPADHWPWKTFPRVMHRSPSPSSSPSIIHLIMGALFRCMPMHGDAPSSTRAPTPPPPPSPPR